MLINDINRVKEILPVNVSFEFQKLKPFVFDAERIIEETIGSEFYNELDTHYNTDPFTPDAAKDNIITLLQEPITYLAFYLGFDILNTVFSNQGFHRIENEESGKKTLFQRQEENLRQTFKSQGYNRLDICLKFLEDNKTDYPTWTASEAYTLMKSNFINSTKEYNEIYNINNSRLVFLKLRNIQKVVEDFDIIPLIGRAMFDELKQQIKADSLTPVNLKLVELIKKAVAHRTIFRGGVELLTELNEYGLYKNQIKDNIRNFKTKDIAEEEIYLKIFKKAEETGQAYLKSVESFMKTNITDYPLFENSTAFDDTRSIYNIQGTDKIGFI